MSELKDELMSGHTGKGGGNGVYELSRLGLRYTTTPLPQLPAVTEMGLALALNTEPGEGSVVRSVALLWRGLSGQS